MSTRTWLSGFLCLALLPAFLLGVAPPPVLPGSPEIDQLINQLGDRSYRTREQAERRLQELGLTALPQLRRALGHRDHEVRRRVLRLVPSMEHAILVAPRRVTLALKDRPLKDVLDEISKQTGYKVVNQNGGFIPVPAVPGRNPAGKTEDKFTFNWVNAPFWEVMDDVCREGNLTLQQGYGDEMVRLFQNSSGTSHLGGTEGAFRYIANNMTLYRNVDLSTLNPRAATPATRTETLTFNFNLFAEPRLPFLGMNEPRIEVAYDSERNSMIQRGSGDGSDPFGRGMGFGRRYYGGGYKQNSMQVSIQLTRVSEKAASMKILKGVVPVQLLVEQKPIVLSEKILAEKTKKVLAGDVEFNIEEVKKLANNQFSIKFTATNKGNLSDHNWMNTMYQRLELLDAKGNKYQNWGSSWHGSGGNNVTMTLTFSSMNMPGKVGEPTQFIFQHWVTRTHDIAFEFKDVPLP